MRRGEVYIAELVPRSGSEQQGKRPVIVISHDGFNLTQNWRSIIVVPVSSSANQAKRGSTAIFIPKNEAGLTQDSIALCHQVTTLDRAKLAKYLGTLTKTRLYEVENGLKAAMDLT